MNLQKLSDDCKLTIFQSAVDDPVVIEIAKELGKDPAQVLVSWSVQRGTVVLPKSVTPSRIASNFKGRYISMRCLES